MNRFLVKIICGLAFVVSNGLVHGQDLPETIPVASRAGAVYREPSTGLEFPAELGGITRGEVRRYDDSRLGLSIPYTSRGMAITVYFYNLGLKSIPNGVSALVKKEIESNKDEIMAAKRKGVYQEARVVSEKEAGIGAATNHPVALQVMLELRKDNKNQFLALYLTGYKNQFLKIRCTYAAEYQVVCEAVLQQFLDDLGNLMAGKVRPSPVVKEETVSKEEALNAIEVFRYRPLSPGSKRAVSELMTFAEESDEVSVTLSTTLSPWRAKAKTDPKAELLLVAFVAGNVKAQLRANTNGDDAYAGVLQMLATYGQIKEADATFSIAEIERFIELEKKGKLREHLKAILKEDKK